MKVEDGKCYRTRDGRKKGPMKLVKDENTGLRYVLSGKQTWDTSGVWWEGRKTENDLVAEWVDEPNVKVEAGKFYRTEGGLKAGPAKLVTYPITYWRLPVEGLNRGEPLGYGGNGLFRGDRHCYPKADLIAEWLDAPFMSPANEMTGPFCNAAQTPDELTAIDHPTISTEGRKDDAGKDRYELLPPEFLSAVARVLTFGAKKYEDRNWEKGMSWGRVFGAANRHLWAWWGGAGPTTKSFLFGDLDSETGYSHLWHAACCLAFLVAYEERRVGTDDRAKKLSTPA